MLPSSSGAILRGQQTVISPILKLAEVKKTRPR